MISLKVETEDQRQFNDQILKGKAAEEDSRHVARQLVDLEILYLLNFGQKSGYELKKSLLNAFHLNISYGTLYPHLHSLEKAEMVTGAWKYQDENAPLKKRMYSLTTRGAERLGNSIGSLSKIAIIMQFMLTRLDLNLKHSAVHEPREDELAHAAEIFSNLGYSVKTSLQLRGYSGVEHSIDLYASKECQGTSESIILKIASSDAGITIEKLFKIYVTSYDLRAMKAIVLSVPPAEEEVLRLAQLYGVCVYSGKNVPEAIQEMASHLSL